MLLKRMIRDNRKQIGKLELNVPSFIRGKTFHSFFVNKKNTCEENYFPLTYLKNLLVHSFENHFQK